MEGQPPDEENDQDVFASLSNEISCMIFDYLPPADLAKVNLLNKNLKALTDAQLRKFYLGRQPYDQLYQSYSAGKKAPRIIGAKMELIYAAGCVVFHHMNNNLRQEARSRRRVLSKTNKIVGESKKRRARDRAGDVEVRRVFHWHIRQSVCCGYPRNSATEVFRRQKITPRPLA
jgi:hypothetical protein